MTPQDLIAAFEVLGEAPEGVQRLRELVLQLAVRGKLVPQDPGEAGAAEVVRAVAAERSSLVAAKLVPKPRKLDRPALDAPFEVPIGWSHALLDDVAVYIQRGKSPKYDDDSPIRVVSQKCVQWSGFDLSRARGIRPDTLGKYKPERFLRKGDLLWNSTGTGTVGRINLFPGVDPSERVVADSHVTVVRLGAAVDPAFICLWLSSPLIQGAIDEMTSGTTKQQELNTSTVRVQWVPIPPLAEQHRIVARVDELMGLLDRLEAAREARDGTRTALRDAALAALRDADDAEAVTDAWARIAEHMDDLFTDPADVAPLRQAILQLAVRGRLVPSNIEHVPLRGLLREKLSNGRSVPTGTGYPVLRLTALRGSVVNTVHRKSGAWTHEQGSRYRIEQGDLLVVRGNGSKELVARGAMVIETEEVAFPDTAIRLRPDLERVSQRYLFYAWEAPSTRTVLEERAKTTAGIWKVSQADLYSVVLPVPALPEQHRIVAKVDALMALCDDLEARLTAARDAQAAFAAAAVHHLDA